jgi:hypothetical protein
VHTIVLFIHRLGGSQVGRQGIPLENLVYTLCWKDHLGIKQYLQWKRWFIGCRRRNQLNHLQIKPSLHIFKVSLQIHVLSTQATALVMHRFWSHEGGSPKYSVGSGGVVKEGFVMHTLQDFVKMMGAMLCQVCLKGVDRAGTTLVVCGLCDAPSYHLQCNTCVTYTGDAERKDDLQAVPQHQAQSVSGWTRPTVPNLLGLRHGHQ